MTFFNEYAQVIGHDAKAVVEWLAAHPAYIGAIWASYCDDSDDIEVTEAFRGEVA